MADVEQKQNPQPIPRLNFQQFRQAFQNIGIKVIKGAFQSLNFVQYVSGWRLTNISAEFYGAIFNIGGTVITINNTQDIQDNLDIIEAAGGGTLYLQNGTYTLTSDIIVPSGVILQGVSRDGVILDCNGSFAVRISGSNAYSTGTVTINNGDTSVVGSGTTWTSGMVGQFIFLDGLWYEITAFTDTTHITITEYEGDNLSGSVYVMATVNFSAQVNNVTIIGATGSGLIIQYAQECLNINIVVTGCGTGIDMDYVVFPKLECTSSENGVNLNMNFVNGFSIDFSEFNLSMIGAGIIMTDTKNATFFDSSVNDNLGDGINATNCDKIAFLSFDISGNGGQGIEFVSGCDDNQFSDGILNANISDGIKLTASDDRNTLVAVSVTNNGGYGINIADSTCDTNQIIAPAFSGNTSGNINDIGNGTFISPQEFFVNQDIPIATGTFAINSTNTGITSDSTGLQIFYAKVNGTTLTIYRLVKDAKSGNCQVTHSTTLTIDSGIYRGMAVVGSFLYVFCNISSANACRRYAVADLSGVTTITISGGSTFGTKSAFGDGTSLYVGSSTTSNYNKFSISGTTITFVSNITLTSSGDSRGGVSDGVSIWVQDSATSGTITFRKYPVAGGAATSTVTKIFQWDSMLNGNPTGLFIAGTSLLGIAWSFNWTDASAVVGMGLHLTAITYP